MRNSKQFLRHLVLNKVEVYGNVFHPWMKYWINTDIGGPYIVAVNHWRTGANMSIEFMEKVLHLINFSCSGGDNSIFCFGGRPSHIVLFLRALTNWIETKKDDISWRRSLIIRISCPVSIHKGMESVWWVLMKNEAKMNCSFEITKNPFNCRPVISGWVVHELR